MAHSATRLQAARLAAGYVVGKDGADALGIPHTTYRASENGKNGLSNALVHAAVSVFGTSADFLRSAKPITKVDELAERIARVIDAIEEDASDGPELSEMTLRLRQVRLDRGYRTAAAAAKAMGWAGATYASHEAGYNPVPIERLIGYALAFGIRPEYVLLGEQPQPETMATQWKDLRASGGRLVSTDGNAWSWLRSEAAGMPVLAIESDGIVLLQTRLAVPALLLPFNLADLKGRAYAIVDPSKSGSLHVVDPNASEGRMVVIHDGKLTIGAVSVASMVAPDPVRKRTMEPFRLGALVHTIALTVDEH